MILLDTNIIVEFFKGREPVKSALDALPAEQLLISAATHAEMVYGALDKAELRQIIMKLSNLATLPITTAISGSMLQLMESYCLSNRLKPT